MGGVHKPDIMQPCIQMAYVQMAYIEPAYVQIGVRMVLTDDDLEFPMAAAKAQAETVHNLAS